MIDRQYERYKKKTGERKKSTKTKGKKYYCEGSCIKEGCIDTERRPLKILNLSRPLNTGSGDTTGCGWMRRGSASERTNYRKDGVEERNTFTSREKNYKLGVVTRPSFLQPRCPLPRLYRSYCEYCVYSRRQLLRL